MIRLVSALFLTIVLFNAKSQQQANLLSGSQRNLGETPFFSHVQVKKNSDYSTKGSTYYINELKPGKIKILKNKTYVEDVELRYDIYFEQLQVRANGVYFAAENDHVSDFVINDGDVDHWFYNSKPYAPDLDLGFIRSIYKGEEIAVFAKDIKRERKNDSSEPYSSVSNTIEYLDEIDYYIYSASNSVFYELKSKKKLLEKFPSLKEFGNISKSNLKNEKFLPELAMFLEKSN